LALRAGYGVRHCGLHRVNTVYLDSRLPKPHARPTAIPRDELDSSSLQGCEGGLQFGATRHRSPRTIRP
jgi:hypothetical protein